MQSTKHYHFVGQNKLGQTIRGELHAINKTVAKINLHQQGITTQKIYQKPRGLKQLFYSKRLVLHDLMMFTKQLATLLSAGVPLIQALLLLNEQFANTRFSRTMQAIYTDVKAGLSFAQALRKCPKYFSATYCQVVEAGEQSGTLTLLLTNLSAHLIVQHRLKQEARASFIYPLAVLIIAGLITLGILLFVVPAFESFFESYQSNLPLPTQLLIHIAQVLKTQGIWIAIACFMVVLGIKQYLLPRPRIKRMLDNLWLKLPLIRAIFSLFATAHIFQVLSVLLKANYPLVDGLLSIEKSGINTNFTEGIRKTRQDFVEGLPLHYALKETGLFSKEIIQCIHIGEASGRLQDMIHHIATQQAYALQLKLEGLSQLLEPVLMALLGLWIGGIIFALYLPIFQLGLIIS